MECHTDRKLLHGIAEKLYREYDNRSSKTAVPKKPSNTMNSSETVKGTDDEKYFGITNPNEFPFGKETISPTKMQLPQGIEEQVKELGAFLNFDFDEAIKSLSKPAKNDEKVNWRG